MSKSLLISRKIDYEKVSGANSPRSDSETFSRKGSTTGNCKSEKEINRITLLLRNIAYRSHRQFLREKKKIRSLSSKLSPLKITVVPLKSISQTD